MRLFYTVRVLGELTIRETQQCIADVVGAEVDSVRFSWAKKEPGKTYTWVFRNIYEPDRGTFLSVSGDSDIESMSLEDFARRLAEESRKIVVFEGRKSTLESRWVAYDPSDKIHYIVPETDDGEDLNLDRGVWSVMSPS